MSIDTLSREFPWPESKPLTQGDIHGFGINRALYDLIPKKDNPVFVEVGVWLGSNLIHLLEARPEVQVIAVDHWKGSPEHKTRGGWKKRLPHLWENFCVNVWRHKGSIIPVKLGAEDAFPILAQHEIQADCVYIDGAHDYDSVARDCRLSLETFPNAVITGDDYPHEPLKKAVHDVAEEFGLKVKNLGRLWWYEGRN